MTKTTRMWGVLGVVAVIVLFVWWPNDDAPIPAPAPVTSTAVTPSRPAPPARTVAYYESDLDREAIAQDLRLADRIKLAEKQRRNRFVLEDMRMIALMSCAMQRGIANPPPEMRDNPEMSLAAVRRDPLRVWAYDYLEQACEGIDIEVLQRDFHMGMPDFLVALQDGDEATAIALAQDALRDAESGIELTMALHFLERRGKSPLQTAYRTRDNMANAFIVELALSSIRCRGLDMCGTQNALIALACLTERCARGTTIEQHWRSQLSPKEIETAMKLREELERYRASPVRR